MRGEKVILKMPLWCNGLCTDLVPLPGYHPVSFPFFVSKTMRSINLIDFREMKVHILVETKDMPVDCFAYKKLCFGQTSDGRLKLIYVTSDKDMANTVVEEVVLGRYFMKALSVATTGLKTSNSSSSTTESK